jgi:hypothetical protein
MTLRVEHLLLPSHDRNRSAQFLADLLNLEVTGDSSGSAAAHFSVVQVGDITIDYGDMDQATLHHVAFAVDAATFDAVLGRVEAAGLENSDGPVR